jgi:hypothetical protein
LLSSSDVENNCCPLEKIFRLITHNNSQEKTFFPNKIQEKQEENSLVFSIFLLIDFNPLLVVVVVVFVIA